MPISLTDLKKSTRKIEVEVFDQKLAVEYRPGSYTLDLEDLLFGDVPDGERYSDRSLDAYQRLIASWELLDETGTPLPVTAETLRQVPSIVLREILRGVGKDMNPPAPTSGSG